MQIRITFTDYHSLTNFRLAINEEITHDQQIYINSYFINCNAVTALKDVKDNHINHNRDTK